MKESDIEDLVQQTFLQVHRARRDYDSSRSFRPWLFTIAFNQKRELLRRRRRRPEAQLDEPAAQLATTATPMARSDARQALDRALHALPNEQSEVIALHWFAELPFTEVAAVVGASVAAVKLRAHRAYVTLRAELGDTTAAASGEPSAGNRIPARGVSGGPMPARD